MEIAQTLRDEKVLSPKAAKGTRAVVKDPYGWSALTITRLLGKTVYNGYWTKTIHGVEHRFTCEPVVGKELFEKVQHLLAEQKAASILRRSSIHNRYAGIICDSKYGFCLHLRTFKNGVQYFAYDRDQRIRSSVN